MSGSSSGSRRGSGSIKGLFVGSGAQLIRELPFNDQMAIYEMLQRTAIGSGSDKVGWRSTRPDFWEVSE